MASTATASITCWWRWVNGISALEDLLMVVNFFSKVTVDDEGRFQFVAGNSRAGDYVELFAPMDVLLVLTARCRIPQDPATEYAPVRCS